MRARWRAWSESVISAVRCFLRAGQSATASIDGLDEMRFLPAIRAVPLRDRVRSPAIGLVFVALIAGVRRSVSKREIRPRHAEAVVAPHIDDHVGVGRHVAVDAERAGAIGLVMMMLFGAELRQRMAFAANCIQVVRASTSRYADRDSRSRLPLRDTSCSG